ncbi:MAG: TonB-dependent siderophore receptor, partial [Paraburkholderia sp.]
MFNKTPPATALALALAVPFTAPAFAQTASSTPSQGTTQATPAGGPSNESAGASPSASSTNGTLPTIAVSSQADQQDFQAQRSTVGAKTPTALRDIPQTVTVINKAVLQSQGATSLQDALR